MATYLDRMITGFHTIVHSDDAETAYHQSSLMCDDINATIGELRAKSMAVDPEVQDPGFGLVASIHAPGAGWIMLSEL